MGFDFGGRPRPLRPEGREPSGSGVSGGTTGGDAGVRPWWLWPAAALGAVAVLIILLLVTAGFWANLWWFDSLGFRGVLLTRYVATIVSFLVGFAIAALFIGSNLIVALRAGGGIGLTVGDVRLGRRLSLFAVIAVTVALSGLFALSVGSQWELFLRFLNRTSFGIIDPQFHQDISFYVFTLPVFAFWRAWAMSLIILTAIAVAGVYAAKMGADLAAGQLHLPPHTRTHLSLLGVVFLIGMALGYWLDTRELVYSTRGVVEGASYTDVNAQIPANYILLGISLIAAVLLAVNAFRRQLPLLLGTLGVWAIAAVLIGSGYPAAVQSVSVRPNELSKETPYIDRNIAMTRQAYNIDQVTQQQLPGVGSPTQAGLDANKASVSNIRLWDTSVLLKSYAQLQQIRQYYAFKDVDVDRYQVDAQYRQIMLSARELDSTQLAAQSQTWQNRHLIYTHGYGVVASTANEVVGGGNPNIILGDIPPRGPSDLQVQQPRIYYGEATNDYVFVKTNQPEFDRPSGTAAQSQGEYTTYTGGNGVPAGSFVRKAIFAAYFGEPKVLLSSDISGNAEALYRRNITDRLHTIAPFLRFDNDPYLVIMDGRLVWVNDAYTLTDRYPYATQFSGGSGMTGGFNYIRNSVKATVDAYDGTVRLYVVDPSDPIIATWQKIYPSLFVPGSAASPSLRAHFRYPEDYFNVQTALYTRYHVTNAQVFYGSEDQWAIANEQVGASKTVETIASYYVLVKLPGQQQEEYALVRPFTPGGGTNNRQNMVAFLAGRSDGANYGKLVDYEFPRELTVQGPQQVEARINQEPDISSQITLLDQAGSQVILGNFLIIPIENTLLYVEPLYVQATNSPFPELKRVIVASQNSVVMRATLDEAIAALVSGAPVTTGTTAGPAAQPAGGPGAGGGTDATRAADALNHYQRAQDALKTGDWATFGSELAQVQQILQQIAGSPAPPPTSPNGTPAGTPRQIPSATPKP
ncbi:MAG: UPF0182 family protein [Thermomicrobia bacterium]|nr:UPF0182 family protein [Thermomicrobia bacterium]